MYTKGRNMALRHNPNRSDFDFPYFFKENLDQADLKNITKDFCRAYKAGMIPEDTFHHMIEGLLATFIEHSFDAKVFSKTHNLDRKLFKIHSSLEW